MKNVNALFTFVFLLLFQLQLSAQLDKGTWNIDGNINFGFGNDELNATTFSTFLTPKLGYFFTDNLLVGTRINFSRAQNDLSSTTVFGASPYVRYYFKKGKFMPFAQADLDYLNSRFKIESFSGPETFSEADFHLRFGVNYMLSKNVAFEAQAGFRLDRATRLIRQNSDFEILFGNERRINLGIGLNFFLHQKEEDGEGNETIPLVERYLKSRNTNIGYSGALLASSIFNQ